LKRELILRQAAETDMSLRGLKTVGDAVVANLASIGLSLDHCHVPGMQLD
jgi:dihydroxyacetone kinase